MKNIDFTENGIEELTLQEQKDINGGLPFVLFAAIAGGVAVGFLIARLFKK